jgi:hypothetical protein
MPKQKAKRRMVQQLVLFVNPAPLGRDDDGAEAKHRDNTEWYVVLPGLGISVQARDLNDEPIIGYWPDHQAVAHAMSLWMQYMSDPELLEEARKNPEFPSHYDEDGKVMQRTILVPA